MKKILLLVMMALFMVLLTGCGGEKEVSQQQKQENQEQVLSEEDAAVKDDQSKEESKPIIDIPNILEQDYAGVTEILGNPVKEENEDFDTKYVYYSLEDFEIGIKYFDNTPMFIEITPLKEYRYVNDREYGLPEEVPDDVMKLLTELGFNYPTWTDSSLAMRVFSYKRYGSPLREYKIQVSCKDWRVIDNGKASTVNIVIVRLIDTK